MHFETANQMSVTNAKRCLSPFCMNSPLYRRGDSKPHAPFGCAVTPNIAYWFLAGRVSSRESNAGGDSEPKASALRGDRVPHREARNPGQQTSA